MVVAAGVAMNVMYLSTFESLRATRDSYYDRQRFADVFATLKRAPQRVGNQIGRLPGVSAIETRVSAVVTLDMPGMNEPATARLVSIAADRRPQVNDLFVRRGRWIEAGRPDEVLVSEGFVTAHGLQPGDRLPAVVNGRLRRLTIVGVALSPEFVYTIPPGDLVPDDKRFGIVWMDKKALAAAFDMEGGFNDLALTLAPGTSTEAVITRIDRMLEPYGGRGAIARATQLSHWTVENELAQLQTFGFLLPMVFLLVAAFILNVALTRALALQRPQIAALKALGYDNREIGWHYLKWALAIGAGGIVIGVIAAIALTRVMASQLVGVTATDPVTFVAMAVLFMMVAAFAAWIPARRAAALNPNAALRDQ
jgi:putative ABC transport system permease protein